MASTVVNTRIDIQWRLTHGMIDDKVHGTVHSLEDGLTVVTVVLRASLNGAVDPVTPVNIVFKDSQCKYVM